MLLTLFFFFFFFFFKEKHFIPCLIAITSLPSLSCTRKEKNEDKRLKEKRDGIKIKIKIKIKTKRTQHTFTDSDILLETKNCNASTGEVGVMIM